MHAIAKVKICGLTSVEQALATAEAGADALGLVFHKASKRHVDWRVARAISDALPPFIQTVGLFVNESRDVVDNILTKVHLDILQFHGEESDEYCRQFGKPYIKSVRVRQRLSIDDQVAAYSGARALLLDTYDSNAAGGTGKAFNWQLFPEHSQKPLILAGGLNPQNVATAIAQCHPYAVDVSSGVEDQPGDKSIEKIRQFIQSAKSLETLT